MQASNRFINIRESIKANENPNKKANPKALVVQVHILELQSISQTLHSSEFLH
jgi:hypothetical protein